MKRVAAVRACGRRICIPSQSGIDSEISRNSPLILHEGCELLEDGMSRLIPPQDQEVRAVRQNRIGAQIIGFNGPREWLHR
ncbi:MAG TPA: hypothetical protein VMR62_05980, partial [Bryobacteraceae bacterium]|nr:hypothetical protein [Bryobacteraceae bacterium]